MSIIDILLNGQIVFQCYGHELRGFRPFRYAGLPWKNKREKAVLMDNLEEEDTRASFQRVKELETSEMLEKYHILASRALVTISSGIMAALLAIAAQLNSGLILSIIFGSVTFLSFALYIWLRHRMKLKEEELVIYRSLMDNFETWSDLDNIEFDI